MGSGISGPVIVANVGVGGVPNQERKLSSKFPSNYNLETFHKFRDVKLKDAHAHGRVDGSARHDESESALAATEKQPRNGSASVEILRPGIYTTVYSYYHWKNKYVDAQ